PEEVAPPPKAEQLPGKLTVAIQPWCDLTVDGKSQGRAPLSLELPAGPHHIECSHPSGKVKRDVTLAAGETTVMRDKLLADSRITPRLAKGVEFTVDDGPRGVLAATPGRHRITLYREGKAAEARWLTVEPEGCRLVD